MLGDGWGGHGYQAIVLSMVCLQYIDYMFTTYIYLLYTCLAAVPGIVVESVGSLRFSLTPKVLAIIGGSGAGKTTLLDTVLSSAFRNKNDSGLRPIRSGVSEDVLSMLSMSLASVSAHYCS